MRRLVAAILGALLLMAGLAAPSSANGGSINCPTQPNLSGVKMPERPVVYVHGWLGRADKADPSEKSDAVNMLQRKLGNGYKVLAFDYSWANQEWGASQRTRQCLASYIREASAAFSATGGDGRVLAVGHSMGGIAIRAASSVLPGSPASKDILAGVVTLGTPHRGSPWGGTVYADLYQSISGFTAGRAPLPESATSAALCLAWPRAASCDDVPYLPVATKIATVGAQITMTRKLFDIPFVEGPTAEFPLFGDAIVPVISSNGYVLSASGTYPKGAFIGETQLDCSVTSGYLSQRLAKSAGKGNVAATAIAALLGTLVEEAIDTRALDMMLQGKADASQASYVGLAMASECFHSELPTNEEALDATASYLKRMAAKGSTSSAGSGNKAGTIVELGATAELSGKWSGSVYGAQSGYDLVLDLSDTDSTISGTAEYPQLKCGGTWTETGRDEYEIRFDESITSGGRCVKEVKVFLTRTTTGLHVRIAWNSREIQADLERQ